MILKKTHKDSRFVCFTKNSECEREMLNGGVVSSDVVLQIALEDGVYIVEIAPKKALTEEPKREKTSSDKETTGVEVGGHPQPKKFLEILELQRVLDSEVKSVRQRILEDIKLSMIAEIIEFNEECLCSHKTWKTKPFDINKEKEEAVDILFFFAQLINHVYGYGGTGERKLIADCFKDNMEQDELDILELVTLEIIEDVASFNLCPDSMVFLQKIAKDLALIYKAFAMTEKEVYKVYYEKWQKNLKRIGGEWN